MWGRQQDVHAIRIERAKTMLPSEQALDRKGGGGRCLETQPHGGEIGLLGRVIPRLI